MTSLIAKPPKASACRTAAGANGSRTGRPLTKLRTIEETAELLNVSPRTVRRLINAGALQSYKFGRLVRIADGDIAILLAANRSF